MTYTAYALGSDGCEKILEIGTIITSFRNEDWTYQGTFHPRKVYVNAKEDPNGDDFWPNMEQQEFYASVFNLGIKDDATGEWTFEPSWDLPDQFYDAEQFHQVIELEGFGLVQPNEDIRENSGEALGK